MFSISLQNKYLRQRQTMASTIVRLYTFWTSVPILTVAMEKPFGMDTMNVIVSWSQGDMRYIMTSILTTKILEGPLNS